MSKQASLRKRLQHPIFWGSLMLNVILVGLLLFGGKQDLPHPPVKPSTFLQRMGEDLTGQDKVVFETALEKYAPKLEQHAEGMFATLEVIVAEIKKQSFSMEALQQAHVQLNGKKNAIDLDIGAFVMDVAGGISPEGRQKLKLMPPHHKKE